MPGPLLLQCSIVAQGRKGNVYVFLPSESQTGMAMMAGGRITEPRDAQGAGAAYLCLFQLEAAGYS
jgi:hypothetical protein